MPQRCNSDIKPLYYVTLVIVFIFYLTTIALSWFQAAMFSVTKTNLVAACLVTSQLVIILLWILCHWCNRYVEYDVELKTFIDEENEQHSQRNQRHNNVQLLTFSLFIAFMLFISGALIVADLVTTTSSNTKSGHLKVGIITTFMISLTVLGLLCSIVIYFINDYIIRKYLKYKRKKEERYMNKIRKFYTFSS